MVDYLTLLDTKSAHKYAEAYLIEECFYCLIIPNVGLDFLLSMKV